MIWFFLTQTSYSYSSWFRWRSSHHDVANGTYSGAGNRSTQPFGSRCHSRDSAEIWTIGIPPGCSKVPGILTTMNIRRFFQMRMYKLLQKKTKHIKCTCTSRPVCFQNAGYIFSPCSTYRKLLSQWPNGRSVWLIESKGSIQRGLDVRQRIDRENGPKAQAGWNKTRYMSLPLTTELTHVHFHIYSMKCLLFFRIRNVGN